MGKWAKLGMLGVAMLLLSATEADAQTATSSFTVTATVSANCTVSTVGITFGAYDPVVGNASTPLDANGSVTVACTAGAATTMGMDQGSNPTATSTAALPERQMADGPNALSYGLYQDSARTTVWGDVGTPAAVTYNSVSFAPTTLTIFGQVPSGQDINVGTYSDTVTATISF